LSSKLSLTEKLVLALLEDNPKGTLNANRISSRLPREAKINTDHVYKALLSLTSKKMAEQPSKGNFRIAKVTEEVEGILEFTKKGDAYLLLSHIVPEREDLFVPREFLNRALPGDRVVCTVLGRGKRPKGEVTKVLERAQTRVVGTLEVFESSAFLIPNKQNFPFDIRIQGKIESEWEGMKAVCMVKDFPNQSRNPVGVILEIIGKPGMNDTEMHSIVAEFGFSVKFPEAVEKEAAIYPENLEENQNWPGRRDMRGTLTFTIDPEDAKDFDDAISYQKLEEGKYELGIHIADVSHYVEPNTALDNEALLRGTSVYLADRTIPMLPEKLSNNLCSLKPDVDRLAFSAIFIVDDNCHIIERWYGKSVIHSQRRFSYEQAQERIVSGEGDLHAELQFLNGLAKKLHTQRKNNGALGFESDEIRFKLDDNGKPLQVLLKKRFDAHKLIEEFMLLANREVAEFVKKKHKPELPFIYRIHDNPNQDKLIELSKFCQLFGYKLDLNSEKNLRHSLNKLFEDLVGKPEEDVINQMAIRSMAKAVYTGSRSDHFGLAFEFYTHFTSPIRRYPDLLVHRLLQHYLLNEAGGYTAEQIEMIAKHSSNMEQKAAEAERASTKYKMAEYLQQHIGTVFEAVVSGVTEWGIFAEIIENHCEGMIRISDMRGDNYYFLEKERKVVGTRTRKSYKLGDLISIRVKNANPQARMIDFTLAD